MTIQSRSGSSRNDRPLRSLHPVIASRQCFERAHQSETGAQHERRCMAFKRQISRFIIATVSQELKDRVINNHRDMAAHPFSFQLLT